MRHPFLPISHTTPPLAVAWLESKTNLVSVYVSNRRMGGGWRGGWRVQPYCSSLIEFLKRRLPTAMTHLHIVHAAAVSLALSLSFSLLLSPSFCRWVSATCSCWGRNRLSGLCKQLSQAAEALDANVDGMWMVCGWYVNGMWMVCGLCIFPSDNGGFC